MEGADVGVFGICEVNFYGLFVSGEGKAVMGWDGIRMKALR